ncbi:MAG TPA: hypothetical protein VKI44_07055 [Acetobacteraceae bacterium]|nr:hypothetical protein [Acetobacteraceae bacterium]
MTDHTHEGSQMPISPEKLAELTSIPVEAAKFILSPPPHMSEQQLHSRLQELVPLTMNRRSWIWEIHKNCDQLLHQRLASFTAAQAMTLAAFSVLTVARFNATVATPATTTTAAIGGIPPERLWLLDIARVSVILFGMFLAAVGGLVTYPMFKRLKYLNKAFLFEDNTYCNYFHCIEWDEETWDPKSKTRFPYPLYARFIPFWLPAAEVLFWAVLFGLLVVALWGPAAVVLFGAALLALLVVAFRLQKS